MPLKTVTVACLRQATVANDTQGSYWLVAALLNTFWCLRGVANSV